MLVRTKRIPLVNLLLFSWWPSFLKVLYYRLIGYNIGEQVNIGFGSILKGKTISIGKGTKIGLFTIVICEECNIEKDVEIGSAVYIKVKKLSVGFQTTIRENNRIGGMDIGRSELVIGSLSHIHQGCIINTTMPVKIGNNTAIGGGSYIFTHSSWQSSIDGYPCTFESVEIGHNVWISWNVFILPAVTIGDNTLVSAGSIVTKSLPQNCLASGNPAKIIIPSGSYPRSLEPDEITQLIFKIFSDYKYYLEVHGYSVFLEQFPDYHYYKILSATNKIYSVYLNITSGKTLSFITSSKETLLVSLVSLEKSQINLLKSKSVAIIDFVKKTRMGKNDISNETVKFLKHFGLRFQNT